MIETFVLIYLGLKTYYLQHSCISTVPVPLGSSEFRSLQSPLGTPVSCGCWRAIMPIWSGFSNWHLLHVQFPLTKSFEYSVKFIISEAKCLILVTFSTFLQPFFANFNPIKKIRIIHLFIITVIILIQWFIISLV